jgi:hypothetical protein
LLTTVSGTFGSYNTSYDVITSITLVTNIGCYGPFGKEKGISFNFPIQGNGSIVGFFGHAELYIDAIGVYVNPWVGIWKQEEKVLMFLLLFLFCTNSLQYFLKKRYKFYFHDLSILSRESSRLDHLAGEEGAVVTSKSYHNIWKASQFQVKLL